MKTSVIVTELRRIAGDHKGLLLPADLVQAARPKSSPLHDEFEWDDSEAAERYRLWQARQLIAVAVEYFGSGKDAILSRVFVSLTTDRKAGGYRAVDVVMRHAGSREQLLQDALEDLERIRAKYEMLQELAGIFLELKKLNKRKSVAVG